VVDDMMDVDANDGNNIKSAPLSEVNTRVRNLKRLRDIDAPELDHPRIVKRQHVNINTEDLMNVPGLMLPPIDYRAKSPYDNFPKPDLSKPYPCVGIYNFGRDYIKDMSWRKCIYFRDCRGIKIAHTY
jgi:hypothetical protein